MTSLFPKIAIGAAALLFTIGVASAQTAAPQAPPAAAPKAAAPAAAPAKAAKGVPKTASTPEGIECSSQADAKNLHGKERKSFRAKCIRDLKKAKAAPKPAPKAAEPAKKS